MANPILDLNTPFQSVDGQPPTPVVGQVPTPMARPAQADQPEFNVSPITPEQEEPFQVDATPETTAPPSSPETLDSRSFKIKYGLGDIIKKTRDEIYSDLQQGSEPDMRDRMAGEIDQRKTKAVEDVVRQATANKGEPLTQEEVTGLTGIIKNLTKTTDPQTVFEEAYGKQFISEIEKTADRNPDNVLTDARQKYPEQIAADLLKNSSMVAKREILLTKLQNVNDEIKSQNVIGWGYDQAKSMTPGYTDVQLRQNIPSVGVFAGLGLGSNLEAQRTALLRMEPDEMKAAIDKAVDSMKANPSMAATWLNAMVGEGDRDILFHNLSVPMDAAGLGIGKAALKSGKGLLTKVLGKEDEQLLKDAAKATRDMAQASADPNLSKSSIEAASGDLKQSATTRAVANFVGDANQATDATRRGLESLSTVHRTDLQAVKANPGRFGQDIVNRIEEMYDAVGPIMDKAAQIGKVERLPEIMSNEVAVRSILDSMKDTYKGIKNSIIDVSKPYKENLAGNWFVDFYLGHNDGTYFTKRSTAENFIEFHGLKNAEIAEGKNKSATKASRANDQVLRNIQGAKDTIEKINARLADNKYATPAKRQKDEETKAFLTNEAIPNYEKKLVQTQAQKATVEQQGLGFYIKITKPINETDDAVRDVIASTTNTKIPENSVSSFLNSWGLGKYRTPEDALSKADRANRLIATYNPSELTSLLRKNSPNIERLATVKPRFTNSRQKWEDFQRAIDQGQELWDVNTKKKGYFFESPDELESAYMSWFKRLPDEDEVLAYFEFKRNMEIDRSFRNIAEHRNQSRVGAETHKIISTDAEGKSFPTPEFSGVTRKTLGGTKSNVAIIGDKYGFEKVKSLARMPTKDKEALQELIDNGTYKLIELYNPELRPLNGYGAISDDRIRYVLAKTVETRDLDWSHIPRRGGGHIEYDYNYYIKQAKMKFDKISGDNWYEGDTTVMPVQVYKMGIDFAKKLDAVRKLLKDKQDDAARAYSNTNLHIPWETVQGWFKGELQPDGKWSGARLSLHEPIQVVERNRSIASMSDRLEREYKNFRNGEKEGSLARQNKVDYSQERDSHDVFTIDNKGTADNPLYSIAPAAKVDPITVLNRGLNKIAKSNFMDDYKTMSVEHWLQQAGKYLNATESEIRHSPFYYFNEAKFLPGTDPIIKGQLETAKFHIQQLVGQPSDTAQKLQRISQKLADAAYTKIGPESKLANEWDLSKLRDPFALLRTMTYHVKMGLFNIPQFIVQAGNYSNILGIAGYKYAAPGTLGAQLHFWSRLNSSPELIDLFDRMASRFNLPGTSHWRPGEFKEAFEEFKKTGFGNVGGEYAALDDPMNQKWISQGKDTFLDASTFFVRNGERNSRYGSWYTAFKEFRDKKPFGKLTEQDRSDILQRADLLNINMSRASSSALHTGIMSIPTQFLTYQIRLFELFVSKRITPSERFRMFYTNSLLYGLPMGVGLTGIPASGYFRQVMMENGYVVGDDFFKSAAMEGLLSAIGAVATGKGDPSAGDWFDFGDRLGNKGLEFLGGMNRADKTWLDVAGGPAYSIIKGTVAQSDGFLNAMMNLVRPDSEMFPIAPEDFIDPLKEISSVNSAFRTLAVLNTGRWVSKKEGWLADSTPFQAMFAGLTSFKDQRINDIQTLRAAATSQKEYEKYIENQFLQEYRRAVVAGKNNDEEGATKYFTRAKVLLAIGGYPEDRISSLVSRAANDNKSVLDRVTFDFYTKQTNRDQGMDSLARTQRVKQKKEEIE